MEKLAGINMADHAGNHMLVSMFKACMSQYTPSPHRASTTKLAKQSLQSRACRAELAEQSLQSRPSKQEPPCRSLQARAFKQESVCNTNRPLNNRDWPNAVFGGTDFVPGRFLHTLILNISLVLKQKIAGINLVDPASSHMLVSMFKPVCLNAPLPPHMASTTKLAKQSLQSRACRAELAEQSLQSRPSKPEHRDRSLQARAFKQEPVRNTKRTLNNRDWPNMQNMTGRSSPRRIQGGQNLSTLKRGLAPSKIAFVDQISSWKGHQTPQNLWSQGGMKGASGSAKREGQGARTSRQGNLQSRWKQRKGKQAEQSLQSRACRADIPSKCLQAKASKPKHSGMY